MLVQSTSFAEIGFQIGGGGILALTYILKLPVWNTSGRSNLGFDVQQPISP